MLYLLLGIAGLFLVFHFAINDHDFMHPSVIFSLAFFLYILVCVCGQSAYEIKISKVTVEVIFTGLLTFSAVSCFCTVFARRKYEKREKIQLLTGNDSNRSKIEEIYIPNSFVVILILLQIVTTLFFIRYLRALADAYMASYSPISTSIGGLISFYDTLTKFWTEIFRKLNVPIPMGYRIGNPVCAACEYLLLYVSVHNFTLKRKINPLHLIVFALMLVRIMLNGSRSPVLRVITFAIVIWYVTRYRMGRHGRGEWRTLFRLILIATMAGVLMVGMLFIMGRTSKMASLGTYMFTYLGAPVVNLDTFLKNTTQLHLFRGADPSELWGAQTFKALYAYIGKYIDNPALANIANISRFSFSKNGIEIGNVYTMFYKYIYDFGYFGVVPMTAIMALYYTLSYEKITQGSETSKSIKLSVFYYAYLFNDLVMSAFSCRFYETVVDAPFLKMIVLAWICDAIFVERRLRIGGRSIMLPFIRA